MAGRTTQKDINRRDDAMSEQWQKDCVGLNRYDHSTARIIFQSGFEGGEYWARRKVGRSTDKKERLITQGIVEWEGRLHQHTDYWLAFTMGWDAGEEYGAEVKKTAKKKTAKKKTAKKAKVTS